MKSFEPDYGAGTVCRWLMRFGLLCILTSMGFAAPKPKISKIIPDSALAGSAEFTLIVKGSEFDLSSEVDWNGSARPTTFVNSKQLEAGISRSDVAAAGTAAVTVKNSDPGGVNVEVSKAVTFTIFSSPVTPLTITTAATLPDGLLNAAYSQTLSAFGGTPPYIWAISSGSLPPGLSLAPDGTLSGTLTSSGTFSFTVRVRDSAQPTADSATKRLTLIVKNPVPAITGISPNSAIAGGPDFTLTVNGSNFVSGSTVRWNGSDRTTTFSSVQLTASIPASDINTGGTASVTVNNPSPGGGTSNALTFTISAPLTITTAAALPDGLVNTAYSQTLSASGGTKPYTWAVTSGSSLPPGLSLTASNGMLSGTLTSSGTFSFSVRVRDSAQPTAGSTTKKLTLTVKNPKPAITGITPNSAVAGGPGFTLTVNGSNFVSGATVQWNGSDRPTTFSGAKKLMASIPASDVASAGTASVTVINPGPGGGASNALSFETSTPAPASLTITSSSPLPNGIVGAPYSQTLSASGGIAPYQWSVSSGAPPPGVSLSPGTGVLSGTASAAGDFNFTLQVSDSTQPTPATATKAFALRINNPVPTITGLNPSSASAGGSPFTLEVIGSNFLAESIVTWNGLSRPTTFSSRTRLTASISNSDIASPAAVSVAVRNPSPGGGSSNGLTFTVLPVIVPVTITSSSPLPNGFVGSSYSQTLSASGGTSPYTWSTEGGSLPAGLTLDSTSGVISGTVTASGSFQFTVRARDSLSASADKSFQLSINPSLPAISISGPTDPVAPAQQPTVEMSLAVPYPSPLSGQMTLTFTSDADEPSDDPAIQFATGGRTVDFTIPANTTGAVFPNSATSVAFQSGTVAGTITISIAIQSDGNDVTPAPAPSRTFTVNPGAPTLSRLSIASRTASGFDVEIIGFSTPRSLTQVVFRFAPRAGSSLGTSTFTVPVGPSAATWFQSDTSKQFGSLFRLVIPFAVQGDVNAILSVSATLSNAVGTSQALSTNL